MEPKKRLAYTLGCAAITFVGLFHVVLSTIFDYGFRPVGVVLLSAGVFGVLLVNV